MKSELESVFAEDPPAVVLGELEVVTLGDEDVPRAAGLLEEEHYLGAARPVGRTQVQAVHHQGRWVALLVWGPAALKLANPSPPSSATASCSRKKKRATLGWPSNKAGTFRPAPSYAALYNLLCKIDPHGFAAALNGWLADSHGTLPRGLAIDGKYVRNLVLTLCLSEHESGAPAAIAIAAQAPVSEENKKEGELTCARRLYATTPLYGATV